MNLREFIALAVLNIASTQFSITRPNPMWPGTVETEYSATAAQCCAVYRDDPRFERMRELVPELLEPRKMAATLRNMGLGLLWPHYKPLCKREANTGRWSMTQYGIDCHGA